MDNKEITLELKSEQLNEMLSRPPSWLIRSGTGFLLIIIGILVSLTWFIRYPDEIIGNAVVTTSKPPIELSNQFYAQMKRLPVHDLQTVRKGQIIAEFDAAASAKDIFMVKSYLKEIEHIDLSADTQIPTLSEIGHLGTFQQQWIGLQVKIREWNRIKKDNILEVNISSLRREITYRERLQSISSRKIKLSENDYAVIKQELESSERLSNENLISKQSFNQDKRNESQALSTIESQKEQYVQNLIQLNSLRTHLTQLESDKKVEEEKYAAEIMVAIAGLQSGLTDWEKNSVWISPCNGKILFNKQLQQNQFYASGEASIVVVPVGNGYVAHATISSEGAGRVRRGQKANIELVNYPKFEFGTLEGVVSHITQIEKEGKYEVTIQLPKQLITGYGKLIPPKARLSGTVKILTKKKRLLERFFEKLTDLIK